MAKQSWKATGRRKQSSAQVILTSGTGNITVNISNNVSILNSPFAL